MGTDRTRAAPPARRGRLASVRHPPDRDPPENPERGPRALAALRRGGRAGAFPEGRPRARRSRSRGHPARARSRSRSGPRVPARLPAPPCRNPRRSRRGPVSSSLPSILQALLTSSAPSRFPGGHGLAARPHFRTESVALDASKTPPTNGFAGAPFPQHSEGEVLKATFNIRHGLTLLVAVLAAILVVLAWRSPGPDTAPIPDHAGNAQRLVAILQYLEADYPAAVASGDRGELAEQLSLSAEAVAEARRLRDPRAFADRVALDRGARSRRSRPRGRGRRLRRARRRARGGDGHHASAGVRTGPEGGRPALRPELRGVPRADRARRTAPPLRRCTRSQRTSTRTRSWPA